LKELENSYQQLPTDNIDEFMNISVPAECHKYFDIWLDGHKIEPKLMKFLPYNFFSLEITRKKLPPDNIELKNMLQYS
jgi:hypothetical protein